MTENHLKDRLQYLADNTESIDGIAIAITFKEKAGIPNAQFMKHGTPRGSLPLLGALKNLYRDVNAVVVRQSLKRKWAKREL